MVGHLRSASRKLCGAWTLTDTAVHVWATRADRCRGDRHGVCCCTSTLCWPEVGGQGGSGSCPVSVSLAQLRGPLVSALCDPESRGACWPFTRSSGNTRGELASCAVLCVCTGDLLPGSTAAGNWCALAGSCGVCVTCVVSQTPAFADEPVVNHSVHLSEDEGPQLPRRCPVPCGLCSSVLSLGLPVATHSWCLASSDHYPVP